MLLRPFVAHADWSTDARKRWLTVAAPAAEGWRVSGEPVGELSDLLTRLRDRAGGAAAVLGVDAAIGLPLAFRRSFPDFPAFLRSLLPDDPFFQVCTDPAEITLDRPFYPQVPRRGQRRQELYKGLGLGADQLLRRCEQAVPPERAASCLFWTLGGAQVGKGAIRLWRDVLGDALRGADPPALWPFDGELHSLSRPGGIVVAETYPADAGRRLPLGFRGGKRNQADRAAVGGRLYSLLDELNCQPDKRLSGRIAEGFGAGGAGEDEFDSLVGLLRMLQVVRDPALDQLPPPEIRRWEGWILGRPVSFS